MFIVLKPNVLTWHSDEYEYVSQARNFALFSKLETSFYSAKAILYGNFPTFGYHPILYSFLMGLFLKIFSAAPWSTFLFNYLLTFLIILIMYFYAKERIKRKDTIYPLILIALFPTIIIFANTQSPEIFLICAVSLIYYIFFKSNSEFKIGHFSVLILLAAISRQKFTFFILAAVLLGYIYVKWLKKKKIVYFLISIIFFAGFYYLIHFLFGSDLQIYPAGEEMHLFQYLKYNGISSLTSSETWQFFYSHVLSNYKNIANILIDPGSNYFFYHWLFILIISTNIYLFFKTKDRDLKKELALILIPECILIFIGITAYITTDLENFTHLRLSLGFLPLNLFYIFIFLKKIKLKIRIVFVSILIPLILISSFYVYKPFYIKKIENSSYSNQNKVKLITETIDKYRYKDGLIISGIDTMEAPLRDYIAFNNSGDKFIRINQFPLIEEEIREFIQKPYIDTWFIREDDYFVKYYLNKWPFIFNINIGDSKWAFFAREDAFPKILIYNLNIDRFESEWKPLSNCEFIIEDNILVINAFGNDPHFENIINFKSNENLNYYLEMDLISPESSYLQVFYRDSNGNYSEGNSRKITTAKGENSFIIKIPNSIIRIDPGTMEGSYIINDIKIYSSKY